LSLSFRFPHQNPVYASPLPHTRYMPSPAHPILLDLIARTIFDEQYRSFLWRRNFLLNFSTTCI
jgi:hypothetical protein